MRIFEWLLTCFVVTNLWWVLTTWPWQFHWNVAPPILFNLILAGMFDIFGENWRRRVWIPIACVCLPFFLGSTELLGLLVSACAIYGACL
jgi:hypothetical protein